MNKKNKNKDKMWTKTNRERFKSGAVLLATMAVASLVAFSDFNTSLFKASILDFPEHQPFNGTVYPVQKVPDWVHLKSENWNKSYSELSESDLVNIPYYDPNQLKISTDNLKWGNVNDDKIRNAKITYSVPYMGNYKLDGLENVGSHLAVDIKIPMETPIFSIANGTVIKSSVQSSGFGSHIVVMHNNFPLPDESTGTIYSSYSHLGNVLVNSGDVVKKGQQIGLSGNSGTATTPHLHFQIDNDEPSWHPFWPFTWQEASDAGYDFFSALNAGLGKDKALATTVSPVKYVQDHLDASAVVTIADTPPTLSINSGSGTNTSGTKVVPKASSYVSSTGETPDVDSGSSDVEVIVDSGNEVQVDVADPVAETPVLRFVIEVNSQYHIGQDSEFSILLRDQFGNVYKNGFRDFITVVSDKGFVTPKNTILNFTGFNSSGENLNSFQRMTVGKDRLKITYDGETYYSDYFEVLEEGAAGSFSDVPVNHRNYEAINYLVGSNIVKGYSDGSFKPAQTVNRAEALKFVVLGNKLGLESGDLSFSDVNRSEWYWDYLYTAKRASIIDGYPDGTFKPANTVNRAEFLKILFNGLDIEVASSISEAPYDDVPVDAWFSPYFAEAKSLGIFDEVSTISPAGGMSRGEVAEAMYRLMKRG